GAGGRSVSDMRQWREGSELKQGHLDRPKSFKMALPQSGNLSNGK
ncbi:hypothetical protein NPIL_344511, partial [Nephila pilipes]